ncbi:hypothetical protein Erwinia_phage_Calisson_00002 [Erwinia phage Calisson]|nr:hypothetical protein Erwinia_phage_Calisson_00002 [Erwinia phage Calisson]
MVRLNQHSIEYQSPHDVVNEGLDWEHQMVQTLPEHPSCPSCFRLLPECCCDCMRCHPSLHNLNELLRYQHNVSHYPAISHALTFRGDKDSFLFHHRLYKTMPETSLLSLLPDESHSMLHQHLLDDRAKKQPKNNVRGCPEQQNQLHPKVNQQHSKVREDTEYHEQHQSQVAEE